MLQPFFRSSKLRIYRTHDSRYVSPCKQYFTNEELNQTAPTPTITTEGAKIIAPCQGHRQLFVFGTVKEKKKKRQKKRRDLNQCMQSLRLNKY